MQVLQEVVGHSSNKRPLHKLLQQTQLLLMLSSASPRYPCFVALHSVLEHAAIPGSLAIALLKAAVTLL